MADIKRRRVENVAGDFYVDETCIDCDTCRWMAPEVFREEGGQSAVYLQPKDDSQRTKALQALVACPTASIGVTPHDSKLKKAVESFPIPVEENVAHCGFHAEGSFGAASYLIQRKEGNVLVDSPRFAAPLVKKLEGMGGVRYLFLTHRDDVADHALFRKHFGCERILHLGDVEPDTEQVEIKPEGKEEFSLADDLKIIPVPGHTEGHLVLLYKNKFLFTGDHLAYSTSLNQLIGFREVCWYSWPELVVSTEKLLNYEFEWVLPGHGRRFHASKELMKIEIKKCLEWMKK